MTDSVKQYLKLKITSDEIDLNTIKNTCEITNSEVAKNVEIDNNGTDPTKWSRDNLIKQFNLLTIYPWFWKQLLKSKANSATLEKAVVMVQVSSIQGGLNVPISELKHFDDSSLIQKKLVFNNDITSIKTYLDTGYLSNPIVLNEMQEPLSKPKFSITPEGDIVLDTSLELYTAWRDSCGTLHTDKDISGFYYELPGVGRYAISDESYFIVEVEYPRTIKAFKSKIQQYITNPASHLDISLWNPLSEKTPLGSVYNVQQKDPDEKGEHPESFYTTTYAYLRHINPKDCWVGPYEKDPNLEFFGAIEKMEITNANTEDPRCYTILPKPDKYYMDSYVGYYLKYPCVTYDFYYHVGNTTPETNPQNDVTYGNLPSNIKQVAASTGYTYTNDSENYTNVVNIDSKISEFISPDDDVTYDNSETYKLNMNLVSMNCKMFYVDTQDTEGPQAEFDPLTGYFRCVFKAKSRDEPMYLDKDNTKPALYVTKRDESTKEYGNINNLLYVQDPNRYSDSDGSTKNYGNNLITLQHNAYFKHQPPNDESNIPTLDGVNKRIFLYNSTQIGMMIEAVTNQQQMKGCYGNFNTRYGETIEGSPIDMDTEVVNLIASRALNYWNSLNKPEDEKDISDNLNQVYDGIAFGVVTSANLIQEYFLIPSFENIETIIEESTKRILYRIIKHGNIFFIEGQIWLSQPLINNGLIVIKNGGELRVRTKIGGNDNDYAYIQNNGIIIREDGGLLTLEEPGAENQNLIRHVSTIESNNSIIFREENIRDLKDTLHSVIIPSKTNKMMCKIDMKYKQDSHDLYSQENCLAVSTNSSDYTLPVWNDNDKELNFNVVYPTLPYDGVISPIFYNIFIPDYLVFKWWGESRLVIEDNIIGKSDSGTSVKAYASLVNEFSNGEIVRQEIGITTSKIQNYSQSGLFVGVDITGSGSIILDTVEQ